MTEKTSSALSTTVDRAGLLLQLLAQHPRGLGINQLARELDTQRAPLGRIIRALMEHRLIDRDQSKRYFIGAGALALAHAYSARYPGGLDSLLGALANDSGMTAMLIDVTDDVMTTVLAKTPSASAEHVYTPPGFRHPDGPLPMRVALDALKPPEPDDSEDVREARRLGFAVGHGNVVPGRQGAAAVIPGSVTATSALVIALVTFRAFEAEAIREPLLRAAQSIALELASSI